MFTVVGKCTLPTVYPLRISMPHFKFYKNPFNQNIFKPIDEHIIGNELSLENTPTDMEL